MLRSAALLICLLVWQQFCAGLSACNWFIQQEAQEMGSKVLNPNIVLFFSIFLNRGLQPTQII